MRSFKLLSCTLRERISFLRSMDRDSNCWCNFGLTYDTKSPRQAELFLESLASCAVAASAVINGNAGCTAFVVVIVLAVAGLAADVGRRACRGIICAVSCSAGGAIRPAGSFTAGRCTASSNVDGGQAAKARTVISTRMHATTKTIHI